MRLLAAAVLLAVAAPAFADETTGTISRIDPVRNTMTLTDKTVWMLPADAMPKDAVAGDRVRVRFVSNADNGWIKILGIDRVPG